MYVKIMSDQDLPDHSDAKNHWLIECRRVSFSRADDGSPVAWIDDDQPFSCPGNVYVMNKEGKTIQSFSHYAPREAVQSPVV
jgi:hypothetical protein